MMNKYRLSDVETLKAINNHSITLGYNVNMDTRAYPVLDPEAIVVWTDLIYHDKADGNTVDGHVRARAMFKVLTKRPDNDGIESVMIDVPMRDWNLLYEMTDEEVAQAEARGKELTQARLAQTTAGGN